MKMNKAYKIIKYIVDKALFLILSFYTALFCFIFHLGWAVDIITVDTPHEEHVTVPFQDYIMHFLIGSFILSVYIYNLFGNQFYKKNKNRYIYFHTWFINAAQYNRAVFNVSPI
ncbi:hypothetical protein [Solibacillus sp. NPDC093137]|uniref:hypothetical protein n=1 Tax=Solibacillus sp. NPDC093137 TaxID=3390678 RepID=UPI003D001B13